MIRLFILLLLTLIIPITSNACECVIPPFIMRYEHSDFIAKARILKVSGDVEGSQYRNVTIEIIEMYKGKKTTSLKAESITRSNCGIHTPENSVWLIFAAKDTGGFLHFNACSGSQRIDYSQYDSIYPSYKKIVDNKIVRTIEILNFLKKNKILPVNQYEIKVNTPVKCFEEAKDLSAGSYDFAIYEFFIGKDLSIKKVKAMKIFEDAKLSEKLLLCIKQNARVNSRRIKTIPSKTKVFLIFFYYPPEGNDKGFLSSTLW